MGHKPPTGALLERIGSRITKLALIRAFTVATAVFTLIAVFFGTAESDRVAVGAPPYLYNLA